MSKKALVFGSTGQDGSYLIELLLKKNYTVYGVKKTTWFCLYVIMALLWGYS